MKLKKRLCIAVIVFCFLGMGESLVSAAEDSNEDLEYTPVILEKGFMIELAEETGITPFAVRTVVNWKVNPKTLKSSSGFKKTAGSTIEIKVNVKPQKKVWIGIMSANTGKIYQSTTTGVYKTFKIKKTDTYHVFVQNFSSGSIQAIGYYRR